MVSEVTETLKLFSDKSSSLASLELSVVKSVLELLIFQSLPPECWVIGIYPHAWLTVVHEIKLSLSRATFLAPEVLNRVH